MTERPSAKELSVASRAFVKDNFHYFKLYLMPLLLPLVVIDALARIGQAYSQGFAVFSLFLVYPFACFALSWHRAVLLGPKPEHAVNPFALKPGEGRFILAFLGIGMIPLLFGLIGGVPLGIFMALHKTGPVIVCYVFATALVVYAIILTLRLAFILPAKSVNAPITLKEAKQISQGLISKLFAASFWWTLLVSLAVGCWAAFIGIIIVLVSGMPVSEITPAMIVQNVPVALATFVLVGLPALVVNIYILAFTVTILSKLYQWSLQNRPLTGGGGKAEMPEDMYAGEKKSLKV